MNLRKFLTFSTIICALFFIYLGHFGMDHPMWQKLFLAAQESLGNEGTAELNWSLGFKVLGYLLLGLQILLYFFGKNWKLPLYLGTFAGSLVLSILVSTWLLTN